MNEIILDTLYRIEQKLDSIINMKLTTVENEDIKEQIPEEMRVFLEKNGGSLFPNI